MAGYYPYDLEELLEASEFDEFDDEDEFENIDEAEDFDEARRRRRGSRLRRPPLRTAKRGGAVPRRPAPGHVTKGELAATAKRLDAKIGTNATAIKTLDRRLNGLSADHNKLRTDVTKLQGSINDVRNMSMLMPLLSSQRTRDVSAAVAGTGIQAGDKVVVDSGDAMSKLLPLLMFSGSMGGSSGGSSGGMFGGDSGGLMMVAMIMAMQK